MPNKDSKTACKLALLQSYAVVYIRDFGHCVDSPQFPYYIADVDENAEHITDFWSYELSLFPMICDLFVFIKKELQDIELS